LKIALTADPEIPVPPTLYGGIERIIDILINGLTQMGHEVTLFAHPESRVPCNLIKWKGLNSQKPSDTIRNTITLFSHIKKGNFEIIHSFSRLAYLSPLLPSRLPKIMSYQREPSIQQIKKAVQLSRKGTLCFTGCSHYITDKIKPFAPARTVYNCVPIQKYQFRDTISDDAPLVFLGRIEPIKGTHLAVEAAKKSKKKLIIAGNIPKEGITYYKEKIEPFLSDDIMYIGPVNDMQKNEILGNALAFLMPIQWNEPFGIVMAEAMACGTPVIGFPYGSVPEVVEEGINGFICDDLGDMVQKINLVNSLSRSRVRAIAEKRFSDTAIVADYLSLYNNCINRTLSYTK
jgi:glycosyltransferase involved in cell wall biosynthesis